MNGTEADSLRTLLAFDKALRLELRDRSDRSARRRAQPNAGACKGWSAHAGVQTRSHLTTFRVQRFKGRATLGTTMIG
jgi:hypothetical protein